MPEPQAAVFAPVLDRLQEDAAVYFRCGPVRLLPLQYQDRPFSHVLRLLVCREGTDVPLSHLFLKVFKPKVINGRADALRERVAQDYETTRRVYTAMLPYPDLGAVPPVACYPELLAIATEQVDGPTLLDHLLEHAAWWPERAAVIELCTVMEKVGRWIQVYQATGPSGGAVSPEAIREYVDHRLKRLVQHGNRRFTEDTRTGVLRHIEALTAQIAANEWTEVAIHSDLALGNVLVSGPRVVVLDFAMAKLGTRVHDLTRLFVQLDLLCLKPHLRRAVIGQLQAALLRGFDVSVKPDLPLFRLLVLLHRVNHLTGLSLDAAPFPESVYNGLVCRHHRRCILEELRRTPAAVEHA